MLPSVQYNQSEKTHAFCGHGRKNFIPFFIQEMLSCNELTMRLMLYAVLLTLTRVQLVSSTSHSYYVKPDSSTECPKIISENQCYSISEYSRSEWSLPSDSTIYFLQGKHTVHSRPSIWGFKDVSNVSLVGQFQ